MKNKNIKKHKEKGKQKESESCFQSFYVVFATDPPHPHPLPHPVVNGGLPGMATPAPCSPRRPWPMHGVPSVPSAVTPLSAPLSQVLQARLHPGPSARLQHGPGRGLPQPGHRPAVRRAARRQLPILGLQLLQQALGGR